MGIAPRPSAERGDDLLLSGLFMGETMPGHDPAAVAVPLKIMVLLLLPLKRS